MKGAGAVTKIPKRKDRILRGPGGDAYAAQAKLAPTVCTQCGVYFADGRWREGTPPPDVAAGVCPACRRIADRFPAGTVRLEGSFFLAHVDEILGAVNNTARQARAEHPLQRIMRIERDAEGASIETTEIHLARSIGTALHHAYQGELKLDYGEGDKTVRVHWHR